MTIFPLLFVCLLPEERRNDMVTQLIMVWAIGVVAFFVLWAVLAKVVHRISERKKKDSGDCENAHRDPDSGEIA